MRLLILGLLVLFGSLLLVQNASATTIALDFETLPSSQGFDYESTPHFPFPEEDFASVNSGTLTLDTREMPIEIAGINLYSLPNVVKQTAPFTLSWRSRVLDAEYSSYNIEPWTFYVGVGTGTEMFSIGMDKTQTIIADRQRIDIDNTVFHDYRIEGTPGSTYTLYVDDVERLTSLPFEYSRNTIVIGNGHWGYCMRAEVTSYVFTQVPEPSALVLLFMGVFLSLLYSRRNG